MPNRRSPGFTLVEILIVVVILGILAAIVVPQFTSASESARQASFITNVKSFANATELYRVHYGTYPEDASTGSLPAGLDRWVREDDWTAITPIGGSWDSERNDTGGYACALGVHFDGRGTTQDDAFMQQIDEKFDDGDLEDGGFRRIADGRYYLIVAE
ncbi:MAG: prepilin-type N-terminal cleavage/methylation domain-containing protein [bacterium]|nr:prepilin-type N-terminal cleavage/methylation domain-containing protein [bacterium]